LAGLVSVVIPSHNYGRFLPTAIESVLAQSYADVEVLVVDDGSTDDTSAVAQRYPIRTISRPRGGLSRAANQGIAASTGALVMRLDADDMLAPTYVEETVRALETFPAADFAYTGMELFGAATGRYMSEPFDPDVLAEHNYIHASALMRRASFDRVGGYAPDLGWSCADWDLWLSFADQGMTGVLVPKPLLLYRQHGSNMSRGQFNGVSGLINALKVASLLQDHHRRTFGARRLLRRVAMLPRRVLGGRASLREAARLIGFYGYLLSRLAVRRLAGQRIGAEARGTDAR
jgi:glycosyltransferase involved in cell wall biosynthesis